MSPSMPAEVSPAIGSPPPAPDPMQTDDSNRLLLITGAAGKTGLAILRRLAADPVGPLRVRALARHSDQEPRLRDAGANETARGDLTDRRALREALAGVQTVYHICPNVHPGEVEIGRTLISLARASGVRRFVYHSVLAPRIPEMPHHWAKAEVESLLAESGLDHSILQPAPYMQNVLAAREAIVRRGVFTVPYALETRVSMVDLEDVAEAAMAVLTGAGHSRESYELCSPQLLDQFEIAEALGRALGREVRPESTDRGEWARTATAAGLGSYQIECLLAMFRYYEGCGMTGTAAPLESLLGRSPTSFDRFARRAFSSDAASEVNRT